MKLQVQGIISSKEGKYKRESEKEGRTIIWGISEIWFWIAAAVVFALIEAATFGLTTIWFAAGAVAAIGASAIGANFYLQTAVFFVVSIALLYFTRPIAKDYLKIGAFKTNVSEIVGQKAVVKKKILPHETGQVKIKGQIWTAVSEDGTEIEENAEVVVAGVEGVKAIVRRKKG